jgi:lipoyl-dependent peroxiredoxin
MITRHSEAEWNGNLKDGSGKVSLGSGAFSGNYGFRSRFENGPGTNPEELIAAAHAGCYSMAFANGLANAGFTAKSVRTTAKVNLDKLAEGFTITQIDLETEGDVPGIDNAKFQELAETAKKNCPVSKALAGPKITLKAKLIGKS